MAGCLVSLFMIPIYLLYYGVIIFLYVAYFGIIALYYGFCFLGGLFLAILRGFLNYCKKNSKQNNCIKTNYNSKKSKSINNIDLKGSKFKDPYICVKINKCVGKKIFKNDEINCKLFGLEEIYAPLTSVYFEDDNYYEFEIYEDNINLSGKLINSMFQQLKNKMIVEIGESKDNIRYRYSYVDNKIIVNNMSVDEQLRYNERIRNTYKELKLKVMDKYSLDDDKSAFPNKLNSYGIDLDFFGIIGDYLDDEYLIYEWYFSEQVLSIMNSIDLKPKYGPLPDIEVINIIEEPKEEKKIIKSHSSVTCKDDDFDKQAKLWGLSKEDKRIAKEERMSPADYVEAEENDDDELIKDEWEN